jgi:uncharacterized protein YegL
MSKLPGGAMAGRPLNFIWLVDCSGSMKGSKIQSLNNAIRESIQPMRDAAKENAQVDLMVRVVKFSTSASWHIATPTPIDSFTWTDVEADGETHLGAALKLVTEQLKVPPLEWRALPPVLVLVSDGMPTDDFGSGLKALMAQPWGKAAVRIAISIGKDSSEPEAQEVFQRFIGNNEVKPLQAHNPDALVRYIRWVSTAVVKFASSAVSAPVGTAPAAAAAPPMPVVAPAGAASDMIW